MNQGLFLVIEGSDGSGKETQCKLVVDKLKKEGYKVELFDFPRYNEDSSYFVREYLNGKYGTAEEVGPYTGSLFYALDRYQAAPDIKKALEEGKVVIANRFTGSNMAHQGAKIDNDEQRKGYFLWLDAIEFQMMGIPRPDLSLVLRVPAEIAQTLVDDKDERSYTDKKRDIHEADLEYLQKSTKVYDSLSDIFPKDFKQLDCVRSGKLLSIDAIHKLIWETIHPLLPAKASTSEPKKASAYVAPTYYTPSSLDEQTTDSYKQIIDSILNLHSVMFSKLEAHIQATSSAANAESILAPVLPAATTLTKALDTPSTFNKTVDDLAHKMLKDTYSASVTPLKLSSVSPRNELDIVADILYEHSTQPYEVICEQIDEWSYDDKAKVFQAYTETQGQALQNIQYTWDIVCDYTVLNKLQNQKIGSNLQWQQLSPRYGYEVPKIIEEAMLTDDYERCFDLSLKLYSILQSSKHPETAQYAILCGHRTRFAITLNAQELISMINDEEETNQESAYKILISNMKSKIEEIHPLVTSIASSQA